MRSQDSEGSWGARVALAGAAALIATLLALGPPVTAEPAAGARAERLREALRRHPLRGLDGRTLPAAALDGEVVVVSFWATWCKPCRRELPSLDALHAELAGKGGRVVAVSIDTDPANVRRFVRTHGLRLPVYVDGPEGLARDLDLDHVPFTMVLDRSGALAHATSGAGAAGLAAIAAEARRAAERPHLSASPAGAAR